MRLGIVNTEYSLREDVIFGIQSSYLRFMNLFGSPESILPTSPLEHLLQLDGIFLPGGPDVDPKRYGEIPGYWTSKPSQYLEHFDVNFLPKLIGKVPLIGICRGLQTLNVALGGSLSQHLRDHPSSLLPDDMAHEVYNEGREFEVNSFHHQGVARLAKGLTPIAKDKNGLVEAFISYDLKIFAVQWHPERMVMDPFSEREIVSILRR